MMVTLAQLKRIAPGASVKAALYLEPLNNAMFEFGIVSERRVEFFLPQVAHESDDFRCVEENLNYSAVGLMQTFRKYFPTLQAATPYARQPQKIANRVYANRMGNGDEASGMGWLHRGAGLIQLTGHDNQKACADYFKIDIARIGDWLRTPEGACRSAAWFWQMHGCNELADKGDFDGVCDVINIGRKTEKQGDAIGYADRLAHLKVAEKEIA